MEQIKKGFMGFAEGMIAGSTMPQYDGDARQIDWNKAREFIEANKERIASVSAGLAEDWYWTSGEVWNKEHGYIPQGETYVYASSTWATPSIEVVFESGETQTFECWKIGTNSSSYFDGSES